jgi:hypothetical protein
MDGLRLHPFARGNGAQAPRLLRTSAIRLVGRSLEAKVEARRRSIRDEMERPSFAPSPEAMVRKRQGYGGHFSRIARKVEAGGIEPPSESDSQRLLRAQSGELISPWGLPPPFALSGFGWLYRTGFPSASSFPTPPRLRRVRFSSPAYERRSGLIPICVAWVRSYGFGPVRRQRP